MTTHPSEFGGVEERLLESALVAIEGQFAQAERIVAMHFPALGDAAKARLTVAVVQSIAINYLSAATIRNLPKG
ncbi:hypothetical protein PE066_03920 [Ramlibacter tataouinensis]|uniref:hypothetical protein n=1 Tax=Ramlibacter tataouinensis TaxID=94132 RepID=UPI0022F3BD64|nr:hypothetical protein [Ramlibacter tataouinensis]WBY02697.1 hypothetical protein PE066_03920 [Ramlibacter tataouinensis]